jgi:hypothetical protein
MKADPITGEIIEPEAGSEQERQPEIRPFNQWLLEQRGGLLHGELTETLAEVAAAVLEHEKAGSVTLKITVTPNEGMDVVFISDDVAKKVPQPPRGAMAFHTDQHGNLTRNNPRQQQIPLRDIPRPGGAKETSR